MIPENRIIEFAKTESDKVSHENVKLSYQDGIYYGFIEGFKKALDVLKSNELLFDAYKKGFEDANDCLSRANEVVQNKELTIHIKEK